MTTWILLRGLTRESGHWGAFIEQFQQALPQAQVLPLDLPGNGRLHRQNSPWRVADMVAHCRAELARRNVAPPYHLLAMSLGAMVAVDWSHSHPHELAAQVLINTSMRPFNPFYQRLLPANYAALLRLAVFNASPEEWERTVLRLTCNHAGVEALPQWLKMRQDHPVSSANALRQLVAAARFRAPQTLPSLPTLLLASEHDRLVSSACSKALARRWQCELRVHPSAGHDLAQDDGPWLAAQVQAWRKE
jgi:pimeloyl-ACP methyl ester carboxylesterase